MKCFLNTIVNKHYYRKGFLSLLLFRAIKLQNICFSGPLMHVIKQINTIYSLCRIGVDYQGIYSRNFNVYELPNK